MIDLLKRVISTMAGVGFIPFASGTFGTLASVPIVLLVAWPGSLTFYLAATVALTALSIWACNASERAAGKKDPSEAVADEMAGFLVTMAFVPITAWTLAAGFFLFRLTDVVKPFPARRLERLPGGWGIVADDLAAGVWANLLLQAGLWIVGTHGHGFLSGLGFAEPWSFAG